MDPTKLSATTLLRLYRKKEISPVEVLESILKRLEKVNPLLNAFLAVDADVAMAAAQKAKAQWQRGEPYGLLCGVPISVKDSVEMAGVPTTYGSRAFSDNERNDAELVLRLRNQGAVLFGKTNLPEFALRPETRNNLGAPGRNPWDLSRTCGGSSGGAGAAVAAGLGPIAIGTDSGGSIRGPSAQNGIFGLKPSFQRIPAVQSWRASHDRSHNGPMSRTVADAALLMQSIAGPAAGDTNSQYFVKSDFVLNQRKDYSGVRIGIAPCELASNDSADVDAALSSVRGVLKASGCSVKDVSYPPRYAALRNTDGVWPYSADHLVAADLLKPNFLQNHVHELTDYAKLVYESASRLSASDYRRALNHDAQYRARMQQWLRDEEIDILLMDCVSSAPVINEDGRATDLESNGLAMYNIARLPVAAIPVVKSSISGMPLGLQVVGQFGEDLLVLEVCQVIEQSNLWIQDWPNL